MKRDPRWRREKGFWLLAASETISLCLPARAEAHSPVKGLGEFANGFLHPFLTPPHLLILLSVGLLLGQHRPLRLQRPVVVFAAFAAAGLSLTAARAIGGVYQPILVVLGLSVGGLVALAVPLPMWVRLVVCAVTGLVLGLDSGVDADTTGAALAMTKTLFATWVSLVLCAADIAFYSSRLPTYQWVQTGIRVAGSWIVAIALLMLAFSLRH